MSESGKNRRDRAAAARNAAQSQERRRERMVRLIGAVTVVVVVVGIIAVALLARGSSESTSVSQPTVNPDAALPAGVLGADSEHAFGVLYGSASADAPVLEVWEDFQCPACASVEELNGAGIAALAEEGTVQLIWRPATFLDRVNEGRDASVANSSTRATAAWGCAMDAGKTREFHDAIYANQPAEEGDGWVDDQFIALAESSGITGADLETFASCVADGTYLDWASSSGATFTTSGIGGTPFGVLDGVEVPTQTLADDAALRALISGEAPVDEADAS
ncbi:MAG: DsbA family protein [Candidatus Nanopelagicales bacterium]|nr:DsbA family protein [Candidatus Nanopelagicales bacterium]MCF8536348.1 DsbA family protein [Candidatus Nanopelagicales bacterium]MCF8541503.1 DsbA family protein [Candidatus Nanopelagicales bacterium]MCF8556329.1 DsbA family protein [Candidatus Nanopelagicales bacterium]